MKIIKFSALWCAPCKVIKTMLNGFDACPIEDIDIDQNPEKTLEYGVRSVPTMILIDSDGKELWRHSGVIDRIILENTIKKYGTT